MINLCNSHELFYTNKIFIAYNLHFIHQFSGSHSHLDTIDFEGSASRKGSGLRVLTQFM